MGRGQCFVIVYSIVLCGLFATFVYLMTTVNPLPLPSKNKTDIENNMDEMESKDDGKLMVVKSKRIDKLLEDLLLLRSNGSIYGVPWPMYPTVLDDSTLDDQTTATYQTNPGRIDDIEDFAPRRVYPPLVPFIEMLLNDTEETTKPNNVTTTLNVSTAPTNTTSIKSHKRSADWYEGLNSDETDKDSDSLFIKILDEVGQARVEIKLGPHVYDKNTVIIDEDDDKRRKKSYNMLIRRNNNEQMMKAKNMSIKIIPKASIQLNDSYIEEQPSKPSEIYSIDLNPTELTNVNDTNHEEEFHNTDEILDSIEAKKFHKILYHWIANSSLNKASKVEHLETNERILAPENKENVRTSHKPPDEGITYQERILNEDHFLRMLESDDGTKKTTTEIHTNPWDREVPTTTTTEHTTTLSDKVREALRNMIDF